MKYYNKFPLYLGLAIFAVSLVASAVKIGSNQMIALQQTRANVQGASLSLQFSPPDLISVLLTNNKEITGIDVALKYDKEKIVILPSSLKADDSFITSGGILDEENETFSFSALAKDSVSSSLVVATFRIAPKLQTAEKTSLDFITSQEKTAVFDKSSMANILVKTQGLTFDLTAK